MSKGDINAFLNKLFNSEGGTNPKIINEYGYIGKYQFGEDALIDLGYYKADGTNNRNEKGRFEYDWVGEWKGKHGINSRSDFLENEAAQDVAAKEWVNLLCKKMKHFKLQSYIGQTIKNVEITESGIIGAAHLKGFGNAKHPGVIQFLKSNGDIDSTDANGTHVSLYMSKFSNYELGCCGSVTAVLIDKDKKPITGLGYQIKAGNKIVAKGKTDASGTTKKVEGLNAGSKITILVSKLEGGFKEIQSFITKEETAFVATLRSATRMVTTQLEKHLGPAGDYKRHSENSPQGKVPSGSPTQQPKPSTTSSQASKPAQQSSVQSSKSALPTKDIGNATQPNSADASPSSIGIEAKVPSDSSGNSVTPATSDEVQSASQDKKNDAAIASADSASKEVSTAPGNDGSDATPPPEQPIATECKRNDDGHPVAIAMSREPAPPKIEPSVQKLEDILMKNVLSGKKREALSGPVAAEKSKKGEPISSHSKDQTESLGKCYKYVKIALLASGMSKHYLGQEAAKYAGLELQKEGYRNLLDKLDHGLKSPYDAPVGAIIVYDVTDETVWGHVEVRVSNGFASDYFSERPRTSGRNEKKEQALMSGRNRKVSGIWVKF